MVAADWISVALFLAAIGSGLIAGLFFIFSDTIMRALARLPAAAGGSAMQSINTTIQNPSFFTLFFGTPAACAAVLIGVLGDLRAPGALYAASGAVLHIVGAFVLTIVCNVPLNNALAAAHASSSEGAEIWRNYLVRWTRWNHVRTVASLAAAALLTVALVTASGS